MIVLILHRMGNPKLWRQSVAELEYALPKCAPEHKYIVHNAALPLPDFVKSISFDGIILGPTFLCARYNPQTYNRTIERYNFIKKSSAFKIALPQDDYDCSAVLDRWMLEWEIDKVYTVCPEHWRVLYPNYLKQGGNLTLGYTGYISNDLIKRAANPLDLSKRSIDVCYRASKLRPNFGRLGVLKSDIAGLFIAATEKSGLEMDISTEEKDLIPGDRWFDFIESAKCTLGTNSGSSLLDPEGAIRQCVNSNLDKNPHTLFEEVEAACFPGLDEKYIFTAVSPRVFEAGLLKTAQILIPGPYSGVLELWKHYIPLNEDLSNVDEVITAIKDIKTLKKITDSCKERLLSLPELRTKNHVDNLLSDIKSRNRNYFLSNMKNIDKLILRYSITMTIKGSLVWFKEDIQKMISIVFPFIRPIYRKVLKKQP